MNDLITIPAGIMSFFWISYIFLYPYALRRGMLYRFDDGLYGHIMSTALWAFFAGTIYTLIYLIRLIP